MLSNAVVMCVQPPATLPSAIKPSVADLCMVRLARQVKKEMLMDEDAGFLNNDTLSIKITVRVLKDSECREYQGAMRKQVLLLLCASVVVCDC